MINLLLFEDDGVNQLYPITTGRAAFDVTCASLTLLELCTASKYPATAWVRPHLQDILSLDHPELARGVKPELEWTVLVNARLVPTWTNWSRLMDWAVKCVDQGMEAVGRDGWTLSAGVVRTRRLESLAAGQDARSLVERVAPLEATDSPQWDLLQFPHDVIRYNASGFEANLQWRLERGGYREIAEGVHVQAGVALDSQIAFDTSRGPILIDENTSIGPFCFLRGPVHIGARSRINEHSSIKDASSLGHTTKLGGEIEGCIIEPFTNKQHHGFLGHSYLGSWINLGAGTCNSDLKNTYGIVNMVYGSQKVPTEMQFIGCIMGDYAKTAINTSIFTGKTIGTCSMVYGFVTTNVPSYVNYARSFGQVTELPTEVMVATQRRMFERRGVPQRPADIQLLHDMYELTRAERQISEEPLNL